MIAAVAPRVATALSTSVAAKGESSAASTAA